ncbi:hypothetical protein F4778DRAFT_720178 [Xylariomycetidae sp. FL2044]|nr:hypothetical protein F4778DRAFT_720178 [Xylariomycetidae sp. FL2044]
MLRGKGGLTSIFSACLMAVSANISRIMMTIWVSIVVLRYCLVWGINLDRLAELDGILKSTCMILWQKLRLMMRIRPRTRSMMHWRDV